jgi:hypothetical protein
METRECIKYSNGVLERRHQSMQPFQGWGGDYKSHPKVAAARQPRAAIGNPFGIKNSPRVA